MATDPIPRRSPDRRTDQIGEPRRFRRPARRILLLAGVLGIALNLRPAVAALGPVLPDVRSDLHLSRGTAGLLTALPVLCFGVLAPLATGLGRRLGIERSLLSAMAGLAVGIGLRSTGSLPLLLLGTVVVGAAIAVGNVLVPALVKRDFGGSVGGVTASYTAALTTGAALAAGLTGPLSDSAGLGWQAGLAWWAVPAVGAGLLWLPQLRRRTSPDPLGGGEGGRVWRSGRAWQVAGFLGAQSFAFYAMLTWLPPLMRERGAGTTEVAVGAVFYNLLGGAAALAVPPVAVRLTSQGPLALAASAAWVVGLVGLVVAPHQPLIWAGVMGLAQGGGFSLALTLLALRAATPAVARELSGMAQAVGYTIAAAGPYAVGALRDLSGSWTVSLLSLVAVVAVMALTGVASGRPGQVR